MTHPNSRRPPLQPAHARAATCVLLIALALTALGLATGCGAGKARAESNGPPAAQDRPEVRVERVETPDGIVILTGPKAASAQDLGVKPYPGAQEQNSSLWVLRPPRGDRYLLAAAEFTTRASLDDLERFYRAQLGEPEVRRAPGLLVLSRNKGSESIVVRVTAGAGAKPHTLLVRRAIEGAPVTLEPWGPPEGPSEDESPPPPPRRPRLPSTPI